MIEDIAEPLESGKIDLATIHGFEQKLKQASCIGSLRSYVLWQRQRRSSKDESELNAIPNPQNGPLSINLDLTVACNHKCSHCVDLDMLNKGPKYHLETLKDSISNLIDRGLQSVIIIGGGEPTLFRAFPELIHFLKEKKLQVGLVTNGTMLERVREVAHLFQKPDWIRLSLDAASEESFLEIHRSKSKKTLQQICNEVLELRQINPHISIGYSFIVIWDGCEFKGVKLRDNVDEIPMAVTLAQEFGFDYISFKPFLMKVEETGGEALLSKVPENLRAAIAARIKIKLQEGQATVRRDGFRIIRTLSMAAALENKHAQSHTRTCHVQAFRQVATPIGIFHCPAYRANSVAKTGESDAFSTPAKFDATNRAIYDSIKTFDAQANCGSKFCFYNSTNHWIEKLIESNVPIDEMSSGDDFNAFF